MRYFNSKNILISLIFGGMSSIIILCFEVRYIFKDYQLSHGFLLIAQFILLSMLFLVLPYSLKYIKKEVRKNNQLKDLEKIGLIFQLISVLLFLSVFFSQYIIFFLYLFYYLFDIICFILLCMGVVLYGKTKNDLAMSFILWSIAMLILSYLFTNVGFWSAT
ncbi:hypothetical protein [Anaerovorax odorimutans]|uniref:hypothetical protein n=1 Tax=Anaerovorax odorimutans TaxID=109327 RepID=UPI00041938BE|nr:hypothetical protein [Anaerovorax odorimutans]